jgi:hypothetical protein
MLVVGSLIGILVFIGFATGTFGTGRAQIDLTPSDFYPVRVLSHGFDVARADGVVLSTNVTDWMPSSMWYPGVAVFQSQPYFSDNNGNPTPIENLSQILIDLTQKYVIGDQVIYATPFTMTAQIGTRTLLHMHEIGDTTSSVSPFAGKSWHLVAGGTDYGTETYTLDGQPGSDKNIDGALCMYSKRPWSPDYKTSAVKAAITSCLTPVYFPTIQSYTRNDFVSGGPYNDANGNGRQVLTPADSILWSQKNFGNSPVIVTPHIQIEGLSNYISYNDFSYNVTLPNGTQSVMTISTNSAIVGFVDAYQTNCPGDHAELRGLVPNVFNGSVNPETHAFTSDSSKENSKSVQTDQDGPISTMTLTGYIHPTGAGMTYTSGANSQLLGETTSLDYKQIHINLSDYAGNCNMEQMLELSPKFLLQPYTEIFTENANVQFACDLRTDNLIGQTVSDDTSWSSTSPKQINWAYGIRVTNVYDIVQFTFKIYVITSNTMKMVSSTGAPLDVAAICQDFGVNTIVKDPSQDLTDVDLKLPATFDFLGWLASLGNYAWIVVAIIAIIVIGLVSWIFSKIGGMFRRR